MISRQGAQTKALRDRSVLDIAQAQLGQSGFMGVSIGNRVGDAAN